jgi:hypothetical protein
MPGQGVTVRSVRLARSDECIKEQFRTPETVCAGLPRMWTERFEERGRADTLINSFSVLTQESSSP